MNSHKTYTNMADIFSLFLSGHPKGPLTPCDTLSLGVLSSLVNAQQGNDPLGQWTDIAMLAQSAIEVLTANPVSPQGSPNAVGTAPPPPQKENLQACKNQFETRLMDVSYKAHRLQGATLVKYPPEIGELFRMAILRPLELTPEQVVMIENM